jgi:hypothetical protein
MQPLSADGIHIVSEEYIMTRAGLTEKLLDIKREKAWS